MPYRENIKVYIALIIISIMLLAGGLNYLNININVSGSENSWDTSVLKDAYRLLNHVKPLLIEEYGVINVTKYGSLDVNPLPAYNFIGTSDPGTWVVTSGTADFGASLPDSLRIKVGRNTWTTALLIQGGSDGFRMYNSITSLKSALAGSSLMVYGVASADPDTLTSDVNIGIEYGQGGGGGCPILFIRSNNTVWPVTNMLVSGREMILVQDRVEDGLIDVLINETGDSVVTFKSIRLYVVPDKVVGKHIVVQGGDYSKIYLVDAGSLEEPYVIDVMGNKLQFHVNSIDVFYSILQPKNPIVVIVDKRSLTGDSMLLLLGFHKPQYYIKSDIRVKVFDGREFIEVARIEDRIIREGVIGFELPVSTALKDSRALILLIESSSIHHIDYVGYTSNYKTLSDSSMARAELIGVELNGRRVGGVEGLVLGVNSSLRLTYKLPAEGYPVLLVSGSMEVVGDTKIRITRDYTMIGSVVIRHDRMEYTHQPIATSDPVWVSIYSPIVYLPGDPDFISYLKVVVEAPAYSEEYIARLRLLAEPIAVTTGYDTGTYPYVLVSSGLIGLYKVEKTYSYLPGVGFDEHYYLYFTAIYERYALFGGYPGQLFDVVDMQNITIGWFTNSGPNAHMFFGGNMFYFNDENRDASLGDYTAVADTVATISGALGLGLTFIGFKIPPSYQVYAAYASVASSIVGAISEMYVDNEGPPVYIVPLYNASIYMYGYMFLDYSGDVSYTVLGEKRLEVDLYRSELPVYAFIIFNRENPAVYGDFDWEDPDSILIWLNFYG